MFSSILDKRLPAEAGINVVCVSPGIPHQCRSRSALFAATDPQLPDYCESLKAEDWPVCAFISQDCRPTNPSEEVHDIETCYKVWEKTLELIGLPSDAVEKLIQGEEVECKYGATESFYF